MTTTIQPDVAITQQHRMLLALQWAYRKHHLEDERIGWDELDELLFTVLCDVMGDTTFQEWLAEQTEDPR